MLSSVKDYASSVATRASETVTTYTSKDKLDQLLIEVTSNDTWQVNNQKMLELADATQSHENGPKIVDHLLAKLKSPAFEYKRIIKSLNAIHFVLQHGSENATGKILMLGNPILQGLTSFQYSEQNIDRAKPLRDKAILILDILQSPHKLQMERVSAAEYRQKFYPNNSGGGYSGAGVGATASPNQMGGGGGGYQGGYNNPTQGGGGAKVYKPYTSVADGTGGAGGAGAPSSYNSTYNPSSISSSGSSAQTYNITNNNNINYNYGSNITAISSEGSVPTFQDKQKAAQPTTYMGMVSGAVGSVTGGLGGVSAGLGKAANSTYVTAASDAVKRTVGVDIRRAMGGKTAAEIAEERLKKDQMENGSYQGGYGGGYQGVNIDVGPIQPSYGPSSGSGSYGGGRVEGPPSSGSKNFQQPEVQLQRPSSYQNAGPSHVGGIQWGQQAAQPEAPKPAPYRQADAPKENKTNAMFAQPSAGGKKRMDEDSDDEPAGQTQKQQQPQAAPISDLLDFGASDPQPAATSGGFADLLGGGIGAPTAAAPQNQASSLLDLGGGNDLMNMGGGNAAPAQPSSGFDFMQSSSSQPPAQVAQTTDLFGQLNMNTQQNQQQQPAQGFTPSPFGAAQAQSAYQAPQPSFSAAQPTFAGTAQPSFGGLLDMGGQQPAQAQQQQAAPANAFGFMQQAAPQQTTQAPAPVGNMFGGMSMGATPQQTTQAPPAGGSMFGGMSMGGAQQKPEELPAQPPKKKDAFSMGANLINF